MGQKHRVISLAVFVGHWFFVTLPYSDTISDVMEFDQFTCQITANCSKTSCCLSFDLMTGSEKIHNRILEIGQRHTVISFVVFVGHWFFVTLPYHNTTSDVSEFDRFTCQITANCSKTGYCLSLTWWQGQIKTIHNRTLDVVQRQIVLCFWCFCWKWIFLWPCHTMTPIVMSQNSIKLLTRSLWTHTVTPLVMSRNSIKSLPRSLQTAGKLVAASLLTWLQGKMKANNL
jgi:hypothetical protein